VTKFKNREQAGEQLASQLLKYQKDEPIVMGIPNGGVPVALPVAQRLNCPLTLVPIRSLPVPWAEETIFGYVTDAGETHINQPLVGQTRLTRAEIYQIAKKRRLRSRPISRLGASPLRKASPQGLPSLLMMVCTRVGPCSAPSKR
jgi:predicted phosphoribosyltransferase